MDFKSAVLSTAYLPPIQYFTKLLNFERVLIEKHETYLRQSYRNRCEIYSANGRLPLIIPVVKPNGNHTKISEVKIDYSVKWQKEHWRALESAYKNSAYFELIMDEFKPFYEKKDWEFLYEYNLSIINTISEIMGVQPKVEETICFVKDYKDDVADFRYTIHPKPQHSKVEVDFSAKQYFQVFADKMGFIPNLSVFDLLCSCGKESLEFLV